MEPKDLFQFVEENRKDVNALGRTLADVLTAQRANPYITLAALCDIVTSIIETNFPYCNDAKHLRRLTQQTLEGYGNAILDAAEKVIRARFNEELRADDEEDEESERVSPTSGNC